MSDGDNGVKLLREAFGASKDEPMEEAARRVVKQYVNQSGRLPTAIDRVVEAAMLVCRPGPGWSVDQAVAVLRGEGPQAQPKGNTRYFAFWCANCPTRVMVETEVPASSDYPDPYYHFSFAEGFAAFQAREPTENDDGLEVADLCPACCKPMEELDHMLITGEVPYHLDGETPAVHAAWLKKETKEKSNAT